MSYRGSPAGLFKLPSLRSVLASKNTVWTRVTVAQWYNAQQRTLLTATGTALWYKAGVAPNVGLPTMPGQSRTGALRTLQPRT
jgi:hypothetical protein